MDTIDRDRELLDTLTDSEREVALSILNDLSTKGESKAYQNLIYQDYDEVPVDIATFIHDKRYLGNGLTDPNGRFTLFPYWEEKLAEIFPTNTTTRYNTIILTGAIGLGKSTIAVICLLYMLYRLLCLKDPYAYYGMQPIDKISISLMNITMENAKGVALDKMNQLILSSEWFMSHGYMSGSENLIFHPEKHIEVITASSNNQVIGRCLDGDTRIMTSLGIRKLSELVNIPFRVVSIDGDGNKVLSDTCTASPTLRTDEEYQIELEDGTLLKCTPEHRFMLKDGSYKMAKDLTEEDELFDETITYDEFIQNIINTRGQWNIPSGEYFEVHHIVPKCMGGEGQIRKGRNVQKHPNLIYLYAHEHFIAHKLLARENPKNKSLVYAWSMMAFPKGKCHRDYEITPYEYEDLRKLQSEILKTDNPQSKVGSPWNKGKHGVYTEETLARIRAPRPQMRGIKKSKETREKMSASVRKRFKERPETHGRPTLNKKAITNGDVTTYINKDEPIPNGYRLGQTHKKKRTIRDRKAYSEQKRRQCLGVGNPMYGHGDRISGGRNGHAIYAYTYKGSEYQCRDDLMVVLKREFPSISESTIRTIMRGNYTKRISNKYQEVIDNLTWRLKKDENQIN